MRLYNSGNLVPSCKSSRLQALEVPSEREGRCRVRPEKAVAGGGDGGGARPRRHRRTLRWHPSGPKCLKLVFLRCMRMG